MAQSKTHSEQETTASLPAYRKLHRALLAMCIALARSRAIPLWAACLIVAGIPFQAAGYGTHQGILQLICFVLIFLGSIPAAFAMLKGRDESTLMPQGEESAPSGIGSTVMRS